MTDVLEKSVTKGDYANVKRDGYYSLNLPLWGNGGELLEGLPVRLPAWWSQERDAVLRAAPRMEGMYGSAIAIAITKMASKGWALDGTDRKTARAREIMMNACHRKGWVPFISRTARDYLTTDNGAFVEIVRATSAIGSRILGLEPLDSLRCTRTGDPSVPVLYRDRNGAEHELRDYQVLDFVDMPDPGDTWNGVGLCATSRAYRYITKLAAIEQFVVEKVTGRRALALYLIGGISPATLEGILTTADASAKARGIERYLGAILAGMAGDQPPSLVTIPFAELPDGFDRQEEWDISLLAYADSIGLDIQDLQPLQGGLSGTSGQTRTLDNKAKGKGMAALQQQLTHALNEFVFASGVTFSFTERSIDDMKAEAEVSKIRTEDLTMQIESGMISPAQALNKKVDDNDMPREFLPEDLTAANSVDDSDGKEAVEDVPAEVAAAAASAAPIPPPAAAPVE